MGIEQKINWYFSLLECIAVIIACVCLRYFFPLLMLSWCLFGLEAVLIQKYHMEPSMEELMEKMDRL